MSSRWPEVGDLLLHTSNDGEEHQGLITEVAGSAADAGFAMGRVIVKWHGDSAPSDYNWSYGYSAVNVHNCFNSFELVKAC